MLTKADLAVLRAALRYFDEELGPHGLRVMRPYFDKKPTRRWTSQDLRGLRGYLRDCEVRYAAFAPAADQLTDLTLYRTATHVLRAVRDPSYQVVTVVLAPRA